MLTRDEVLEVYHREINKNHGSFITLLLETIVHADADNFRILISAVEEILIKYNLLKKENKQ